MKTKILTLIGFMLFLSFSVNAGLFSSCGTISSSGIWALTQNITSESTCLKVTADNVEIDGQGYTMDYSITSTGYGVYVLGRTNITIHGFRVNHAPLGTFVVYALNAHRITFQDNIISTPVSAFLYNSSDKGIIRNNTVTITGDGSAGIIVYNSQATLVTGNHITATGATSNCISLYGSSNNNVIDNLLIGSTGWAAIGLGNFGNYNRISYNNVTVTGSYEAGLYLEDTNYNVIENNNILCNTTTGTSQGGLYFVRSDQNNITGNNIRTTDDDGYGFELGMTSNYNLFTGNVVHSTGSTGSGIYLRPGSDNNTFINNSLYSTGAHGTGAYINSYSNTIIGGSVESINGADYYLIEAGKNNNFSETNFSTLKTIYFFDNNSQFNYQNDSFQPFLKTGTLTADKTLTRTILNWTKAYLQWNDSGSTTAIYTVSRLNVRSNYSVYDGSMNVYDLTSSETGSINFTLALRSEGSAISVRMTAMGPQEEVSEHTTTTSHVTTTTMKPGNVKNNDQNPVNWGILILIIIGIGIFWFNVLKNKKSH